MIDKRLWGARFRSGPDPSLMRLSRADMSYYRLVPYDLIASEAHARELKRAGILAAEEGEALVEALRNIRASFQSGELKPSGEDEDVHSRAHSRFRWRAVRRPSNCAGSRMSHMTSPKATVMP